MLCLFKNKKAQAAIEIAIIGSLIILAFSYLITFTAKINLKQEHFQNVFRKMVKAAGASGKSHANPILFQRMPNIIDPYVPGTLSPVGRASGKILWSSGKARSDVNITDEDHIKESGTYTKTFTRTEVPGKYPVTQRTVTYGGVTRSGP